MHLILTLSQHFMQEQFVSINKHYVKLYTLFEVINNINNNNNNYPLIYPIIYIYNIDYDKNSLFE